jgi:hypothetical protein
VHHLCSHSQSRKIFPLPRPCFIAVVLRIQVEGRLNLCVTQNFELSTAPLTSGTSASRELDLMKETTSLWSTARLPGVYEERNTREAFSDNYRDFFQPTTQPTI